MRWQRSPSKALKLLTPACKWNRQTTERSVPSVKACCLPHCRCLKALAIGAAIAVLPGNRCNPPFTSNCWWLLLFFSIHCRHTHTRPTHISTPILDLGLIQPLLGNGLHPRLFFSSPQPHCSLKLTLMHLKIYCKGALFHTDTGTHGIMHVCMYGALLLWPRPGTKLPIWVGSPC